MSEDDKELAEWRAEWQSLGGRAGLAEELGARVKKDGRRIRLGLAKEISSVPVGAAVCVWLIVRTRGEIAAALTSAALLLLIGVSVSRLITLREGTLDASANTLDAFIELTRRRLRDDLRWARFKQRLQQITILVVVVWCASLVVLHFDYYRTSPWQTVIIWTICSAILGFFLWRNGRRQQRLEAELERFEALVVERALP
jgi:hypothetical protein